MTADTLSDQILTPAIDLAARIAPTQFTPVGLRGNPEAVLAAILTGHELGVGPMIALANIDVIDGRPAMRAHLMRALLARDGHYMAPEESTNTRCVMTGHRRDNTQVIKVTWTMDDAKRAGLDGRPNWRKYPRQMLTARATAELARLIAPDTLGGLYTVEEVEDGDGFISDPDIVSVAPETPPKTRKRRRRIPPAEEVGTVPAELLAQPAQPNIDPEDIALGLAELQTREPRGPYAAVEEAAALLPPLPGEEGYDQDSPATDPVEPEAQDVPGVEEHPPVAGEQLSEAELEETADQLTAFLGEPAVAPGRTVPELQSRIRKLFRLMADVGYWPADDDPRHDSLHQALRRHTGARHLDTLRKGELVVFSQIAYDAAWAATAQPPPGPEG